MAALVTGNDGNQGRFCEAKADESPVLISSKVGFKVKVLWNRGIL